MLMEIQAYAGSDDIMVFDTAGSERMQIDASGRVGIGITPDTTSNGKSTNKSFCYK